MVAEPNDPQHRGRVGIPAAARAALEQVAALTGKTPQAVISVQPTETGWVIGVEVVEVERIPNSADILGLYDAELDDHAELTTYRRRRRYQRGRCDDD